MPDASTPQPQTTRPAPLAGAVMAQLPLFAALLLAPLALLAAKVTGKPDALRHFMPQGMGLYAALAAVALLYSLGLSALDARRNGNNGQPSPARPRLLTRLGLAVAVAALALALHRYLGPRLAQAQNLAPLLDELRLPALALFAGLWTAHFGPAPRAAIARLGGALGALLVLDFLATAIAAKGLVLGGGLFLGATGGVAGSVAASGPATADILATLLCLALCATLDDDPEARTPLAALPRWLILAGLFAGFSRPGLATAGFALLALARGPLRPRLALASVCLLLIWMSLTLPLPHMASGREELGLAWYFTATIEALGQSPMAPFTGLPLGEPLALAISDEWLLPGLDMEGGGLAVAIFEIPSSALRLLAAWGAAGPVAVLAGALFCVLPARPARSRFGFGLLATLLICSALSPALHVPATAGALCLGLAAVWCQGRRQGRDAGGHAADGTDTATGGR